MSKVRMIQLLCPQRHCILGFAYEAEDGERDLEASAHVIAHFVHMVSDGIMTPFCGICQSKDIRAEDEPTIFATMKEARPHLEELERQQAEAAKFWKASKG